MRKRARQETTEMVRKGRELVAGEEEIWRRSLTPLGGRHRGERAAWSGTSSRLLFFFYRPLPIAQAITEKTASKVGLWGS